MNMNQSYWITTEIYFIIYLLCLTAVFYYFIRPLFLKKWSSYCVALSYFISMAVLDQITVIFSNFTAYLIGSGIALLVMIGIEKGNIATKCLYTSLFFAIRWLLPGIFNVLQAYAIDEWLISTESPIYLIIVWTIKYLVLFGCFLFVCIKLNQYLTAITINVSSALILSIPASVSIISYFLVTILQETTLSMKVGFILSLFYLALICIILFFVRIYVHQVQAQLALSQQSILNTQLQMTKQHVTYIESLYNELKGLKHDLGNHFEVLEQLIKNNHVEDATQYVEHIQKQSNSLLPLATGHPVTDVILQQKTQQAAPKNIQLESNFYFPKQLNIEPFDMSIVLNNLLDNAIEATKLCRIKTISINCTRQHDVFLVNVINPIETPLQLDARTGLPLSAKSSALRGIGLSNVQTTLQKYHGNLQFHEANQLLTVTALFVGRADHS